jgi:Flp pilus assembly protein TadG
MVTPTRSGPKKWLFLNALSIRLRDFRNDQRGTIAVMAGLSGTVLVGFGALAIDVGSWQVAQRSMQGAADAAAYSAGIAYNNNDGTKIVTQAEGIAAAQGYVGGASVLNSPGVQNAATLVTVTVNQPPKSGSHTSSATAIEVIIQQPQPRFFKGLSILLGSDPTVTARAVATMFSPPCLLALDPTASSAISISGSANINSAKCDISTNSNSATAVVMNGSSAITTPCLAAVGNVQVTSGLHLTQCTNPTTGVAASSDPYASMPAPTPTGSCLAPVTSGSNLTFSSGHYCSGISISGSKAATFQPGVYYIDGSFTLSGSVTANGTGVTFFMPGGNTVSFTGSSAATFAAPTSGTYSGIVFFGAGGDSGSNNKFTGSGTSTITGVLYFPKQTVTYTGGSVGGTNCTQIVADMITVSGSAYFSSSCVGDGMVTNTVQLVE